jgi:hypothetical protein
MTVAWTSLCAVSDLATHQRINKFLAEGTVNWNTFRMDGMDASVR